jgi:hypothetical protein
LLKIIPAFLHSTLPLGEFDIGAEKLLALRSASSVAEISLSVILAATIFWIISIGPRLLLQMVHLNIVFGVLHLELCENRDPPISDAARQVDLGCCSPDPTLRFHTKITRPQGKGLSTARRLRVADGCTQI